MAHFNGTFIEIVAPLILLVSTNRWLLWSDIMPMSQEVMRQLRTVA